MRARLRSPISSRDVTEETIEEAVAKLHEYGPLNRCAAVIGFAQAAALNWHLDKLGYELPVLMVLLCVTVFPLLSSFSVSQITLSFSNMIFLS